MLRSSYTPELGLESMRALFKAGSPLGPLTVMAERVGRFFQIPLPGFKPYVVFGPDAARKVLVTERDKVLWRNHDPVTDLLRRGVLVTDGDEHDYYRKLMEPSLHPSQLGNYEEMMLAQTERVIAEWRNGQTVDTLVESRKIALLIIMQALFSVDAWNDIPRIWKPILKTIEYISPGARILWREIPRPSYRKHLRVLDEYLYGIIASRRKAVTKKQPDSRFPIPDSRLTPTPDRRWPRRRYHPRPNADYDDCRARYVHGPAGLGFRTVGTTS